MKEDEDFLECQLVFTDETTVSSATKTIYHILEEKTGVMVFDWKEECNESATKRELVSASIRLNGEEQIISLYFLGATFHVEEKTGRTTTYSHINNDYGVGCKIECEGEDGRISNFICMVDFLKLQMVLQPGNSKGIEEKKI